MRRTLSLLTLLLLALLPAAASAQSCTRTGGGYACTFPVDTVTRTDTLRLYCTLAASTWGCTATKPTDPVLPPPADTVPTPPPDTAPPPPPPPTGTNEPRGGTVVADNDWAGFTTQNPPLGKSLLGWNRYAAGNTARWVYDTQAPDDPDVLEILKSGTQGTGPEHLEIVLPRNARQLYIRVPVWVPADYTGSSSGVQKLFHLWAPYDKGASGSIAVPSVFGIGAKALQSQIRIQNATPTAAHATSFNIGGKPWPRGRWVVTEWLLVMNRAGQANGEAHLWQDGQLAATRRGITYSKAGAPWQKVQLNPTYGGTGATPNPPQRLRYGRIRVVTAP